MRLVQNIFEPKASRVLRVLLLNPGKSWTIRSLASEARIAFGYVHAIIGTLTQNGYTVRDQAHLLKLVDPIRLLRRWAAYNQIDAANSVLYYYTFEREVDRVVGMFRDLPTEYALTGLSGAWLVEPQVRPVLVEAYIPRRAQAGEIAKRLQLKLIPRDGNVRLVLPPDDGVFYNVQNVQSVRVVSTVQLYVDLYNNPARGEEAAAALLPLIEKTWAQALLGAGRRV